MFAKKTRDSSAIATLIGAGTTVTGDIEFRDGLHVDGRIVGDIVCEAGAAAALTIGAGGVVEGSVTVDNVVLNGAVAGDVTARQKVELGPTAQVAGNVRYAVLEMAAGARVNGRLIHEAGGQAGQPAGHGDSPEHESGLAEGDGGPALR